jgi:hypothetical protein
MAAPRGLWKAQASRFRLFLQPDGGCQFQGSEGKLRRGKTDRDGLAIFRRDRGEWSRASDEREAK